MRKNFFFRSLVLVLLVVVSFLSAVDAQAQNNQNLKGSVVRIKVHGKGLEGNLEGDSPDRDVSVYLPPSYKTHPNRRYPVIYFLHGFTDDDAKWFGLTKHWINLPAIIDKVITEGHAKEMIIVTPNAYTRYQGSMYSNSITTGNWEDYVSKELVAYIDRHYRTIPKAASRGLAGHSMGGYGALRIGEKHPEVFSSVYLLSPCCLMPGMLTPDNKEAIDRIESVKTVADFEKSDFGTKIVFASAAAWSPNPNNAPLYLEVPYKSGQLQPMVEAKWWANMPLASIDQYITNIKKLHAIAFDAGTKDAGIAASIKVLDQELNDYKVDHTFEIYEGTHTSNIANRLEQKMFAFFSGNLSFNQTGEK